MKILIIIPYFGNWPPWFAYFLQTCEANPDFSWLIYSDCKEPEISPVNVKFIRQSLQNFNHLASRKLNLKINIVNPYKICDLRPAFGKIFEEYVNNFDFWGYSDLDLFYGNLKKFLTVNILANNDLISVRKDYFSGHFALYRNTKIVNLLYSKGVQYRKIFMDNNHHYAYDERSNFYGRRLFHCNKCKFLKSVFSQFEKIFFKLKYKCRKNFKNFLPNDMTSIILKEKNENTISYFAKDLVRSDLWFIKEGISSWKVKWLNGKLIDVVHDKELFHFHIIKSKDNPGFKVLPWQTNTGFTITENGLLISDQ